MIDASLLRKRRFCNLTDDIGMRISPSSTLLGIRKKNMHSKSENLEVPPGGVDFLRGAQASSARRASWAVYAILAWILQVAFVPRAGYQTCV
ncbi:hypothetical protein Taro_048326 [Colocasia esculenta]|uniref:Uncharacterized protein n=1 Tax=Colocasia esculenta TaxID=4460 RepID=A0A843X6D9_COLES|nr:hypothetical protein [Colocasia esculenta]